MLQRHQANHCNAPFSLHHCELCYFKLNVSVRHMSLLYLIDNILLCTSPHDLGQDVIQGLPLSIPVWFIQ